MIAQGTLPWPLILGPNWLSPSFGRQVFRNVLEYRNADGRDNRSNDLYIVDKFRELQSSNSGDCVAHLCTCVKKK